MSSCLGPCAPVLNRPVTVRTTGPVAGSWASAGTELLLVITEQPARVNCPSLDDDAVETTSATMTVGPAAVHDVAPSTRAEQEKNNIIARRGLIRSANGTATKNFSVKGQDLIKWSPPRSLEGQDRTMPPILDSERLAALGDDLGDAEFLRETVEIYLGELPSRQTAMRNAHSVGDRTDMRDRAHSLGSASAMLGLMELESSCRLVELNAQGADDVELSRLFGDWMNSSERALVAVTAWLSTQGS
jgi:HPt (histidine-containing phosphotransfer) domain-containing protein